MSTLVAKPAASKFPVGTSVGLFPTTARNRSDPNLGTPVGAAIASASVAADGSLTFVGVQPGKRYTLFAATFGYADIGAPGLDDNTEPATPFDTMLQAEAITNIAGPASGVAIIAGGVIVQGGRSTFGRTRRFTRIGFKSGTQAAVTPTNQWFAILRRRDRRILARTVDDLATAWPASTVKELAIQGNGWTPPYDEAVLLARVVAAATPPSLLGQTLLEASAQEAGITADTGLTTPLAEGTQLGAITAQTGLPYAYVR
jgi:hypothetical protein